MTFMAAQDLFVRRASGLVREISTSRAFFFNTGAAIAWMPAWTTSYIVIVPVWVVFGWCSWSWAILITGVYCVLVLSPIYAYLASALPRSGGDQVYTTRITSPLLGFLETWTFIWSVFAFEGYGLNVLILTLRATFSIMAISSPEPWTSYATWLGTQTGLLITGLVVMALVFAIAIQPTRRFHTANTVVVGVGLILSAIMLPLMGTLNADVFAKNLVALTGKSMQDVVDAATAAGWSGVGTFDPSTLGIVLGIGLTGFIGFQFSGFLAGELKGNVGRNILVSMIGACIIGRLCQTVFMNVFPSVLGYNWVAGLSYLYYGDPTSTPIPPFSQAFIAIIHPELAGLMAISVIGSFLIGFSLCVTWVTTAVRTAFAWSMDRIIPTSLSVVDSRTKSPLRLVAIFVVLWIFWFAVLLSGISIIYGATVSALLALLVWILPGLNALLLPYRRRDLYDLIPASMKKSFGIPLIAILGIISLAFTVPLYFLFAIWPLFAESYGMHGAEALSFATSSGVVSFAVILVVGIIIYYGAKWYNKRHGIDMDLLYKSVPPE
jgi:APA family basic amino acid/polyamine antiporter